MGSCFTLFEPGSRPGTPRPLVELPTTNDSPGVSGTIEAEYRVSGPRGNGSFLEPRWGRFAEIRRGGSNTMFLGGPTMAWPPSTWLGGHVRGEDAACRLAGSATPRPNCPENRECEFDRRDPAGSAFLRGEGRVTLVSKSIDRRTCRWSARRSEFDGRETARMSPPPRLAVMQGEPQ
ncbi:MAG TPA: DUF1559 domain-containing protein [Planctomycetaceae bacterium]|nr:DUF1559 domain-containing protein [Planctomycetaceae bacterium]